MSAQDFWEDDLLELILTNVAAPNVGDASGLQPSAGAGSFFTSLMTALPAESVSDQTTNEATYTPYARVGIARSAAGWTVASGVGDNDSAVTFPQATAGSDTITHFGLGFAVSGVGFLNMVGALAASLAVSVGITPEFAAGDLDVSLD
jgi:hypothetical protein